MRLYEVNNKYYWFLKKFERYFKILIPATWLELDWITGHFWNKYLFFGEFHHLNSFRRQNLVFIIKELDRQKIEGDILECGVFKGFSSWILLKSTTMQRTFHGVDTFVGLSTPSTFDGTHWKLGDLSSPISETMNNLSEFHERIVLYKGEIPKVFSQFETLVPRFAIIHIDVDLYEPTKFSLEFGWSHLVPGGVLFCDDYGFSTCPGATKAVNDFIGSTSGIELVNYPTGGIAIKKPRS